jgi:type IV pilus assembly protein PilN
MIRINLLPIKQDRRREAGRNQLIVGICALGVEIAILVVLQTQAAAAVEAQRNANDRIKAKVDKIAREIQDHQSILDEIAEFEKRQAAIESLQAARTGPVFVMLELSSIISADGKPTIDHDRYQEMIQLDPASGYDENWDFRRLWLGSFVERDRAIKLSGQALTHEDVAEFLRRVNLSDFFVSSELVSTSLHNPSLPKTVTQLEKADPVVHFVMEGKVRYN